MIIHVKIPDGHIHVDLDVLIDQTGTVIKATDYNRVFQCTAFRLPQARKLCRLIIQYGDEETLRQTDGVIRDCRNEKLRKIWSDEWKRAGKGPGYE